MLLLAITLNIKVVEIKVKHYQLKSILMKLSHQMKWNEIL